MRIWSNGLWMVDAVAGAIHGCAIWQVANLRVSWAPVRHLFDQPIPYGHQLGMNITQTKP
jgi:hypothetical protein